MSIAAMTAALWMSTGKSWRADGCVARRGKQRVAISTTQTGRERIPEKYAWVLLFAVSALYVFRGIGSMIAGGLAFDGGLRQLTGMGWEAIVAESPGIATFIDGTQYESGAFMAGFGLFGMAISSTAYRRGERRAWYASWI